MIFVDNVVVLFPEKRAPQSSSSLLKRGVHIIIFTTSDALIAHNLHTWPDLHAHPRWDVTSFELPQIPQGHDLRADALMQTYFPTIEDPATTNISEFPSSLVHIVIQIDHVSFA